MSQRKQKRERTCKKCNLIFAATANEIKAHFADHDRRVQAATALSPIGAGTEAKSFEKRTPEGLFIP